MDKFDRAFDAAQFPSSLPRDLGRQFEVAQEMLSTAYDVVGMLGVQTDVYPATTDRDSTIRQEVFADDPADLDAFKGQVRVSLLGS